MTSNAAPPTPTPPAEPPAPPPAGLPPRLVAAVVAAALLLGAAGLVVAWQAQQRVQRLEQELVRRQQDAGTAAAEARVLADQAQDAARDAVARVTLLDARLAETTSQRSQIEEALQALTRTRDDNVLADLDAAVRLATQFATLTGSTEPLLRTLRDADARLAALNQPRLERVRRAIGRDVERLSAAGSVDVATLTARVDDVVRQVDELPMLAPAEARDRRRASGTPTAAATPPAAATGEPRTAPPSAPAAAASAPADGWLARLPEASRQFAGHVWDEARGLLRVTRIDHPEAVMLAPSQAAFVRENLKLRLLSARLALLARQFDTAQADLREAQALLERYFDRQSRRVQGATELLRQVAQQSRSVAVPRPDETLAALAAVAALPAAPASR